jgi:hypothetical protein
MLLKKILYIAREAQVFCYSCESRGQENTRRVYFILAPPEQEGLYIRKEG